MALRKLQNAWHRLGQQTQWHSQGVPLFDSRLPAPTRPQEHEPARKKSPRDAGSDCCVQDRESWRQRARSLQLIPSHDAAVEPSRRSLGRLQLGGKCPFLNLPLEIREHIYRLAIDDWECMTPALKPIPPYEPPVCRVSRQIRRESRPIFFSHWRFPIVAHLKPEMCYAASPLWYRKVEAADLRRVTKFLLYFCFDMVQSRLGRQRQQAAIYHVDVDAKTRRLTVTEVFAPAAPDLRILNLQALRVQILQNVREAEERFAANGKWTAHDLELLVPDSVGL